jgi:hypothetical protein
MAERLMLFLLDKSAHEIARRDTPARKRFETFAITGLLATCAMVELALLGVAFLDV